MLATGGRGRPRGREGEDQGAHGAWSNKMAWTPMGGVADWGRPRGVRGDAHGMAGTPTGVWQIEDVHGGMRGRTWMPMGAWSNKGEEFPLPLSEIFITL